MCKAKGLVMVWGWKDGGECCVAKGYFLFVAGESSSSSLNHAGIVPVDKPIRLSFSLILNARGQ